MWRFHRSLYVQTGDLRALEKDGTNVKNFTQALSGTGASLRKWTLGGQLACQAKMKNSATSAKLVILRNGANKLPFISGPTKDTCFAG
jgi:hypothetical protein